MPRAVFIIASSDFRDEEYKEPKDIFEKAGAEVITASSKTGTIKGSLGLEAVAEISLSNIKVRDYDAVVFVGGSGAEEYFDDRTAHKIAADAVSRNKVLGAICIAPVILSRAGVLKNKKATCFPSFKAHLKSNGAILQDKPVVSDGNIITAEGPNAATKFGEELLKKIRQQTARPEKR